ncbi:arylacetamide deacetylase-like [Ptychodera flava]|uniref:arylacetamide deacetylase-like n=1 Tax=Ptychodera flava TaxID=63121 RepID=UPI00396A7CD9
MVSLTRQLTALVLVALIGACVYVPVPPLLEEPLKFTILMSTFRVVRWLSDFAEMTGAANSFDILRFSSEVLLAKGLNGTYSTPGSNTVSSDMIFDGVKVRFYQPIRRDDANIPALIFIHGGGWVVTNVDQSDATTRRLADLLEQVVIVSIDYRLAPEYPFPLPLEDCYRATKYLMVNAGKLGVDADRIGIFGDSAGGNLAAAVALKLTEENFSPKLKFQALAYPPLQVLDMNLPSYKQNEKFYIGLYTRRSLTRYWLLYGLGEAPPGVTDAILKGDLISDLVNTNNAYVLNYVNYSVTPDRLSKNDFQPTFTGEGKRVQNVPDELLQVALHPHFAPLMAPNLRGLPDTFILTCDYDMITDESVLYAARLRSAGVNVEHLNIHNCFHGILNLCEGILTFEVAFESRKKFVDYARKKLQS